MSKKLLQLCVCVGACVPLSAGLAGIIMGPGMIADADLSSLNLDSHYRYLSGLLLAIGLGFVSCVPHIQNKSARFQLLTLIVCVGGLSRLVSVVTIGVPGPFMLFGLVMELGITPLLAFWQYRLAKSSQPEKNI